MSTEITDIEKQILAYLAEAWRNAVDAGLVAGNWYDMEDLQNIAEEWELPKPTTEQAKNALRRFHFYDIQDAETLADAIREATEQ